MKYVIDTFTPLGGKHCVTNALKQIFTYYGHPVSEEFLIGIASGISFCYLNLAESPMALGRAKPFVFEEKVAEAFRVSIKCRQSKNNIKIFEETKMLIDNDSPVQIYVDMPFMPYLDMDEKNHFGGHSVVLFGYDDDKQVFYVSDRDDPELPVKTTHGQIAEAYHLINYSALEDARSSKFRPFPANNKYLEFDFSNYQQPNSETIKTAILEVCDGMLNPPAHLLGIEGIEKFSKEIKKWRMFGDEKLKHAGSVNYYQINADGGSGGGIFRNMYGLFLCEADSIIPHCNLDKIGERFIKISSIWDDVAERMKELSKTRNTNLLIEMSKQIQELSKQEHELFSILQRALL